MFWKLCWVSRAWSKFNQIGFPQFSFWNLIWKFKGKFNGKFKWNFAWKFRFFNTISKFHSFIWWNSRIFSDEFFFKSRVKKSFRQEMIEIFVGKLKEGKTIYLKLCLLDRISWIFKKSIGNLFDGLFERSVRDWGILDRI